LIKKNNCGEALSPQCPTIAALLDLTM